MNSSGHSHSLEDFEINTRNNDTLESLINKNLLIIKGKPSLISQKSPIPVVLFYTLFPCFHFHGFHICPNFHQFSIYFHICLGFHFYPMNFPCIIEEWDKKGFETE